VLTDAQRRVEMEQFMIEFIKNREADLRKNSVKMSMKKRNFDKMQAQVKL
jgi:hypothetical protein